MVSGRLPIVHSDLLRRYQWADNIGKVWRNCPIPIVPCSGTVRRRTCFEPGGREASNETTKPRRFQPVSPALAPSAECRKGADLAIPAHLVGAGRLQLPSSADLLGLCGRGDCPLWSLGWRLDDTGTAVALPSLRHIGYRQRTSRCAAGRAVVPALALWALARRQRTVTRWT
jgi:hypothetical protein